MEGPLRHAIRTIANFRDVGGQRTRDGRRVRTGRLFRSGHLGAASEQDLAALGALGIRTVIDFRVAAETATPAAAGA